jgi:hypothetical protein
MVKLPLVLRLPPESVRLAETEIGLDKATPAALLMIKEENAVEADPERVRAAVAVKDIVPAPEEKAPLFVQLPATVCEKSPALKLLEISTLPLITRLPSAVLAPAPENVRLLKVLGSMVAKLAPMKLIVEVPGVKVPDLIQLPLMEWVKFPAIKVVPVPMLIFLPIDKPTTPVAWAVPDSEKSVQI